MTDYEAPKPVVLCILDGWGDGPDTSTNAIARAETPNWDAMLASYPRARLDASEHHVGLPDGQMGNSRVGHMNLGAGRIVLQDLPRIDAAIDDGSLANHDGLIAFVDKLKSSGGTAHIAGLMSPGVSIPIKTKLPPWRATSCCVRRAHRRACLSRRTRHAAGIRGGVS